MSDAPLRPRSDSPLPALNAPEDEAKYCPQVLQYPTLQRHTPDEQALHLPPDTLQGVILRAADAILRAHDVISELYMNCAKVEALSRRRIVADVRICEIGRAHV